MLKSKTLDKFLKIYTFLPNTRRKELFTLIPLSIISGITEVVALAILARLFNFLINQPRESIPYLSDFFDFDPKYKILILIIIFILTNWFASFIKLYVRSSN